MLSNISKKSYYYLERIIDEDSYSKTDIRFPNYEILLEFFIDNKTSNTNIYNKRLVDIFSIYNISEKYSYEDIGDDILNTLNVEYKTNKNNKYIMDGIFEKISNFKNKKNTNADLEIEQLINNEFYNIKSFLSTMQDDSGKYTTSSDDFVISNF